MKYLSEHAGWWMLAFGLLLFTFFLGLPVFHYATAVMIALIARNHDNPDQVEIFGFFSAPPRRERGPAAGVQPQNARL